MLAVVCPGQGSQKPGFLKPWLEVPGAADRLAGLSAAARINLEQHGTISDSETIKNTAVTQPLIVAAGLLALPFLMGTPTSEHTNIGVGAGHSVGEITAAAMAGVISTEQAMILVRERGSAMAAASAVQPTGMSAVLGGEEQDVRGTLRRHGLTAANANGAGQIVAAGTTSQLLALREDPPAGARVVPLSVAGAFHTNHMRSAVQHLEVLASGMSPQNAQIPLVSNADGRIVRDGHDVLRRLVAQISRPVRWDLTMDTISEMGVTALIELPPAGTLVGLAKRGIPGVETLALKTPDDLARAQQIISEHGGSN